MDRDQLKRLSRLLLEIHKFLMDKQVEVYEQQNGPLSGPGEKLQLLLGAPEFQWLRMLSKVVADIDGHIFQKEELTEEQVRTSLNKVNELFFPSVSTEFSTRYLQQNAETPALEVLEDHLRKLLGHQ